MASSSPVGMPHLLFIDKWKIPVSLNSSLLTYSVKKNPHLSLSKNWTLQEHDNSFNTSKDKFWYNVFEIMISKLYIIFFVMKKVCTTYMYSTLQSLLEQMLCSKTWGLHFFQWLFQKIHVVINWACPKALRVNKINKQL